MHQQSRNLLPVCKATVDSSRVNPRVVEGCEGPVGDAGAWVDGVASCRWLLGQALDVLLQVNQLRGVLRRLVCDLLHRLVILILSLSSLGVVRMLPGGRLKPNVMARSGARRV